MPIPDTIVKPEPDQASKRICYKCFFFEFGDGTGSGPSCGLTGKPFEKWKEAVLDPKNCDLPKAGLRTCDQWTDPTDMEDI